MGCDTRQTRSLMRARMRGKSMPLRLCIWWIAVSLVCVTTARAEALRVLKQAHAHNDYWHKRPLADALEQGFASVEADVFLVGSELLVGHDQSELRPGRTLAALYLEPLLKQVRQNGGSVFGDGTAVTLLLDIKSEGVATYNVLAKELTQYAKMLSCVVDGERRQGAVEVVISGNRPIDLVAEQRTRSATIDGRLSELGGNPPVTLVPLVSESWQNHFDWDGRGKMPAQERAKLREMVELVHRGNRRLRLWATPETEACWEELHAAGIDLIGTDELQRLAEFLKGEEREAAVQDGATGR